MKSSLLSEQGQEKTEKRTTRPDLVDLARALTLPADEVLAHEALEILPDSWDKLIVVVGVVPKRLVVLEDPLGSAEDDGPVSEAWNGSSRLSRDQVVGLTCEGRRARISR